MEISSRVPYQLAREVLPQGQLCDELARLIRFTLPGYLEGLMVIAQVDLKRREADETRFLYRPGEGDMGG